MVSRSIYLSTACGRELGEKLEQVKNLDHPTVLYDGPIRGLCELAPNNVNAIATAAIGIIMYLIR